MQMSQQATDIESIADQVLEIIKESTNRVEDTPGMARHLKVSERQIHNYVARGTIPSLKVGNSRRFIVDDVVAALRKDCADTTRNHA